MYTIYDDKVCITGKQFQQLFSREIYRNGVRRDYFIKHGRAGNGREVYIEVESMRFDLKKKVIAAMGELKEATKTPYLQALEVDPLAQDYFTKYTYLRGGETTYLPTNVQVQYINRASIFNMLKEVLATQIKTRKSKGKRVRLNEFWEGAFKAIHSEELCCKFPHGLPDGIRTLERKFDKYCKEGYYALISGKYGNDNSRRVTHLVERMILSLYAMPNKPFATGVHQSVHTMYRSFLHGQLEVFDKNTGELFNPLDFMLKGEVIDISDRTILNYLNKPQNRKLVDQFRMGRFDYNNTHRPFNQRKRGIYSFSKISMDDRTLPRKSTEGWVNSYLAVDVVSECWVGVSYMLGKPDANLVWECFRDMYKMIDREGFGMPLQVEVERHLTGDMVAELQAMFPYVRVCNAGNSREKRAEHMINQKKYGVEKDTQIGIGRWYAKSDGKRTIREKNKGEFSSKLYRKEDIIADDMQCVIAHNNELHSKQKTYPGMTRWEVLQANLNPNLQPLQKQTIYKYIGDKTETTLRNNDYCRVKYQNYTINNQDVITKLKPNNYAVEAYYVADESGLIEEVYLYQGDTYLCSATQVERYNENMAERTDEDERIRKEQAKRQAHFDKITKEATEEKIFKPVVMHKESFQAAISQKVKIVTPTETQEVGSELEAILRNYDPEFERERALAEY